MCEYVCMIMCTCVCLCACVYVCVSICVCPLTLFSTDVGLVILDSFCSHINLMIILLRFLEYHARILRRLGSSALTTVLCVNTDSLSTFLGDPHVVVCEVDDFHSVIILEY